MKLTAYSMTVALAAALIVSCEDSALLAPTDSVFTVTASPETVVIDEPGGETCETAMISAQIFDSGNYPMQGVEIVFTTDGGTLLEVEPSDTDTDADCGVDAANAGTATLAKETDARGTAVVYLTLTLDDADEVTVTARSGTVAETAAVVRSVVPENQLPEAFITVDPPSPVVFNQSFLLDGRSSVDPDGDAITCYTWSITSDLPDSEVIQGPGLSSFLRSYPVAQTLDVALRVTDDPAGCGADDANFSAPDYLVGYKIVCDPTDPIANAGPNKSATLEGDPAEVTVQLNGGASNDPESDLQYSWDCANDEEFPTTAIATCTYTVADDYNVTLIVTNDCG
jgi:hypothetical protein